MITMAMYEFVVHFIGPAGGDALINRLYEAGWDDATIAFDAWEAGGEGFAEFDPESSSAIQAMVPTQSIPDQPVGPRHRHEQAHHHHRGLCRGCPTFGQGTAEAFPTCFVPGDRSRSGLSRAGVAP
ncbi:hypothetical protein [Nonomuraea turcica]|uniref:hypothetical protein n=1 Tax=Nonomuraea sp. G32 TaxID=3067274 RepID=UPI00273AB0C0|nr:hypothetical protein [Nonomuraea sp. G32]MDP4511222.1 hypothetical protein [Nonomuraea sp. G32]